MKRFRVVFEAPGDGTANHEAGVDRAGPGWTKVDGMQGKRAWQWMDRVALKDKEVRRVIA